MRSIFAIMAVFASVAIFAGEPDLSDSNAQYFKFAPNSPCNNCKENPERECCKMLEKFSPMKPADSSGEKDNK